MTCTIWRTQILFPKTYELFGFPIVCLGHVNSLLCYVYLNCIVCLTEQRRLDHEKNSVNKYLEEKGRKSRSSRNSSRISYIDERSEENKTCVKDYMKRKEQSRLMFNEERSLSSLSVPSLAPVERPISAQSSRSLPTPSPRMSKKALQEVRC